MSSRFNQTKPGVLALSTKRKVMNEFKKIKNQLDQINQDVINPAEQTMPATCEHVSLRGFAYFNLEEFLNKFSLRQTARIPSR